MATRPVRRTGSRNDNITEWMEDQPAAVIIMDDDIFPETPGEERLVSADESSPTPPRVEERPPTMPSRTEKLTKSVRDRLFNKPAAAKRTPTPGRTRKPPQPRKPIEGLIATGWRIMAGVVEPLNGPVARTLVMQAPVAGMILEDSVKDTLLDKILQPLARIEGHGEEMFALLGPPLLVGAISAQPEHPRNKVLMPMLRQAILSWLKISGPYMTKKLKEEAEFAEKYGAQVDAMIMYLFSGVRQDATDGPVQPGDHLFSGAPTPNGAGVAVPAPVQ